MNKKGILLIVLCISLFTISGVSAVNWDNQDFDGYFSMKVPNGVTFEKDINSSVESGINQINAFYMSDNILVEYMDSPLFSEDSAIFIYQSFFESINPESMGCYESQEDNITILEPLTNDGSEFPVVGMCNGNKLIIISGDDVQIIKEMVRSVEFK